ncbi:RNA polymerase sigma factor [Luteimonas soli]|uniref:RNA polymerase sigma factor n=1 Tax=Luteimonas soli TaxID=1648966 RepID=A0ABV7XQ88_9GAMM
MPDRAATEAIAWSTLPDAELVALAQRGQRGAFRELMQRCNQRLFRVARAVVRDDAEAEDVVQEAYTHAFAALSTFRGESSLSTWLTRIVLNEANGRLRRRRPSVDIATFEATPQEDSRVVSFPNRFGNEDPAAAAARAQIRGLIEHAIDDLPDAFRIVFIMREVEGCSVDETATTLGVRPETVKTRLHRARRLLRGTLQDSLAATLGEAFPFLGPRCARMTEAVLARLAAATEATTGDRL